MQQQFHNIYIKILMIHNIQTDYFQTTLPGYLEKLLTQSLQQKEDKIPNFCYLQTKLFFISYKGLSRQRYAQIIFKQFIKYRQEIQQMLQKDQKNQNLLKKYFKTQLYIWKLYEQLKRKQKIIKQPFQIMNKQMENQKNCLQVFFKYFQKLFIQSQKKKAGSFQGFLIETLHQIADSERIPRKFKQRVIQILYNSGFEPIAKYMKILGEQPSGKTTPQGYLTPINEYQKLKQQKTIQKSQVQNSGKNSANSNQGYYQASIQDNNKHKKIFKQSKITPIRTLYLSHPVHHRIYRPKPKTQSQKQQNKNEDINNQN